MIRLLRTQAVLLMSLLLLCMTFAEEPEVIEELEGKVVSVIDGDTIKILIERKTITIRLEGIDAPESKQSFGAKSKQALAKLLAGKSVVVQVTGQDKYKRKLGRVLLDGVNVNATQVENGWAWHFKEYNTDELLSDLEVEARDSRKGLWADPNPLPPWEYRERQKKRTIEQPSAPPFDFAPSGFWLNTSSGVRHNPRCEHFGNTKRGRSCGPNEGRACGICGG